jgi:hypothetical protein
MAKKKKKSKKGKKGGGGSAFGALGANILSDLATGVIAAAMTQAINNTSLGQHLKKGSKKKGEEGGAQADVAASVLKALAARGPLPIAELLRYSGAPLTPTLHAIADVREFRLIEFAPDDDKVRLTASGSRTATAVAKDGIRREADALLSGA